jgi:predicted ATPase/predicted Ser/Thr protein kinase
MMGDKTEAGENHPLNTGKFIANRFNIEDPEASLLGQGGMGNVYRGIDTQTGEAVAIKILKPDLVAGGPELVERFVREGQALRELNHPNIVKMVAALEEAGQHYLVMEYVEGGSLHELLDQQKTLPLTRTLEIALDLADALTRAHRLDIIHRDLKPGNVLLAPDGTPRLTDFGIAHIGRQATQLTQAGTIMGTVEYLSPEACGGEQIDPRADIWAFGVLLFEMLTGERPFTGRTLPATLMAILSQPVPDLAPLRPDVPDALADLVYRMLEKDPQQRLPSVRLVGAELETILHSLGDSAAVFRAASLPDTPVPAQRHNLPAQTTPFVGRETELAELARLLADPAVRLVTILGSGGMGKTRLALQTAEGQLSHFSHGVYFVSLAPLTSAENIVPTIAEALNFSFYEGDTSPQRQLLDYLRQKTMLLILDNFEHLLKGVGLVTDILQAAPSVKLIATSRERLKLQDEQLFQITGIDFPDWETPDDALEYSAVRLFLQSARRVQPGFELSSDDMTYVTRICRLVQGMPLGILLAAAWIEMLSPQEIVSEISQSPDFLETDWQDVPERQQSMRAVFDYSWRLLTEREQEVFQALSVFRGGFTREAAQEVTGFSLRELMALANKSLLHRTRTGRYEMHELLRQYGAEKLDQSPAASEAAHDRHCAYYCAALQQWATDLKGSLQQTALIEMDAEIENARAAWNWAIEQEQIELIDQAIEGLCRFCDWRGRGQEGEAVCRMAVKKLESTKFSERQRVWVRTLAWQGVFCHELGRTRLASRLLKQCLALLTGPELADQNTRAEKAFVLLQLGGIVAESDREKAGRLFNESLILFRTLEDHWGIANTLYSLGTIAVASGRHSEAKQFFEESLAVGQELGDQRMIADSVEGLGTVAYAQGEFEEAESLRRKVVALCREIGWQAGIAPGFYNLGVTHHWSGKFAEAHSLIEKSVAIYNDLGYRSALAFGITSLGFPELHRGQYEDARAQARKGLSLAQEVDFQWGITLSYCLLGEIALVEEAYAEAEQWLRESVAISAMVGTRRQLGWVQSSLGCAARGLGQRHQAKQYLYETLQLAIDPPVFIPLITALPTIALLMVDQDEAERAIELYALALCNPFVGNSRWYEDVVGKHIAAIVATLPPEVVTAAQERGKARDLWETAAGLLVELKEEP